MTTVEQGTSLMSPPAMIDRILDGGVSIGLERDASTAWRDGKWHHEVGRRIVRAADGAAILKRYSLTSRWGEDGQPATYCYGSDDPNLIDVSIAGEPTRNAMRSEEFQTACRQLVTSRLATAPGMEI
jgi:hypothetical protein